MISPSAIQFHPLECRGNYSATSNDMKLVRWPLIGRLLRLVQRGGDWAGLTNHRFAVGPLLCGFDVGSKDLK